jgi:hypothetical protein
MFCGIFPRSCKYDVISIWQPPRGVL